MNHLFLSDMCHIYSSDKANFFTVWKQWNDFNSKPWKTEENAIKPFKNNCSACLFFCFLFFYIFLVRILGRWFDEDGDGDK